MVNADILVDLGTLKPARGYPFLLADRARWNCESPECGGFGELDSVGPLQLPSNPSEAEEALPLRHYRRHADHLLDLVAGQGRLNGDMSVWMADINRATFPQLMSLIQQLEGMLNLPDPEPLPLLEENPSP
ncbi:hypothetical protein [Paracoccus sp. S3-43]|uniref:hypothetical protein n=1 Tax=Paracoccus sp. S3-43 TaxID=3030011 RepID=UPI0023AF0BDA|nr:hypothetical protein [Paracoccus sp. S3-43]WEF22984.1 hypothetical protein PXD02_09010 [Paracoccus sp. S3-43]